MAPMSREITLVSEVRCAVSRAKTQRAGTGSDDGCHSRLMSP
jgi:hypothetical protein